MIRYQCNEASIDPDSVRAELWCKAALLGITSRKKLSEATGLGYDLLCDRIRHPEHLTVSEFVRLHNSINFDLDLNKAVKKGRK